MKLKGFVINKDKIVGVRLEDDGILYDAMYSKLESISQLDLMNLDFLCRYRG